ncbi:hypothetical protein [Psychromonas sp.]
MSETHLFGTIKKMRATLNDQQQVQYQLPLGDQLLASSHPETLTY